MNIGHPFGLTDNLQYDLPNKRLLLCVFLACIGNIGLRVGREKAWQVKEVASLCFSLFSIHHRRKCNYN